MVKTQKLIKNEGAEFKNMFVTSPLCCPSRASILTGRYVHNHGVVNNSLSGNCSSKHWQKTSEMRTFVTSLKNAGYSTFFAGKYLNQYGFSKVGGVQHVPPGWSQWFGLVGNSCYYNYTLSANGEEEKHGNNSKTDYLTDVVFQKALKFLYYKNDTKPFFIFLAPPAPHAPFTASEKYEKFFANASAPRTANFNIPGGKKKHWLLRQPINPLPDSVIHSIDDIFRNRWRTLLSVDDGVENLYNLLSDRKLLDTTFIIFTSDNGYHLGQFSLPWDKRQLYEFDIRVPLLIRGPNIPSGLKIEEPVLNIDLAPTFLTLAGIKPLTNMDGKSFASLLTSKLKKLKGRRFIVEHQGEKTDGSIAGCPQYQPKEVHTCEIDCICEDSWNNTYICVRTLTSSDNFIHCLFKDEESFIEIYNLTSDPYQLNNLYYFKSESEVQKKILYHMKQN